MAKLYGEIASSALMTFDKSFARANGQPLDSTEVYYSYTSAKEYASGAGAYIGQKIVVIENGVITHYSIEDTNGTLKELGSKPVGDGLTITILEDGKISLANIPEVEKDDEGKDIPATYNAVLVNGELTWVKPSTTTVEGLSDLIEALTGRVDKVESNINTIGSHLDEVDDRLEKLVDVVGEVEEGATVVEMIAAAQEAATYDDTALDNRIKAIEEDYLVADDKAELEEAIAEITADETGILAQAKDYTDKVKEDLLGTEELEGTYDTLKEIGKWITEHGVEATELADALAGEAAIREEADNALSQRIEEVSASVVSHWTEVSSIQTQQRKDIDAINDKDTGILNTAKKYADDKAQQESNTMYANAETLVLKLEQEKVDVNTEAIAAINHETTGILAQALNAVSYLQDGLVKDNADAILEINNKLTDIEANADVNIIETVKVNGSALTPDSDKAVDITVPTKFSDITDDSGFDARITAAQAQADKGVLDAEDAYKFATGTLARLEGDEALIGALTTTVAGHTESITDYGTRIGVLENFKISHEAQYNTLSEIVSGHTSDIAKKAEAADLNNAVARIAVNEAAIKTLNETTIVNINAAINTKADSDKVYTKEQIDTIIGTRAEDKSIIDIISEAKAEATYDDTVIKADIKTNSDAIAILNGDDKTEGSVDYKVAQEVAKIVNENNNGTIDTLNEIAAWIISDTTGTAKMNEDILANAQAIAKLTDENGGEGSILSMIEAKAPVIATIETAGIVKSVENTVENGVTIGTDGTMTVNKINVNKLVQTEGEALILNGGNAEN